MGWRGIKIGGSVRRAMRGARPIDERVASEQRGTEDAAPRWARWFVTLFLVSFILCGAVEVEAWPLTVWRLFSHLRHEHQTQFQAYVGLMPEARWSGSS
jgi:hypothetical protein